MSCLCIHHREARWIGSEVRRGLVSCLQGLLRQRPPQKDPNEGLIWWEFRSWFTCSHFISFHSLAGPSTDGIHWHRIYLYQNVILAAENKLTLVRLRVGRIVPVKRRVNLPILAGGGDGPSPLSKSIRSRNSLPWIRPNRLLKAPRSISYLALPDSPMSTLVVNWLVFDDGLSRSL